MRATGIIQPLIRERHPFAVLAVLAFLIPGLLSAAGVTGGFARFQLADGSTVICTGEGFVRISEGTTGQGSGLKHDTSNCCASGCVHAGGKTLPAVATTLESAAPVFAVRLSPAATSSDVSAAPDAPGAIRAPPARSV